MINYPNDAPSHILQCITLHISLLTPSTDYYCSCIDSIVTFADHEAPHFSITCFFNKPQWGNNLRNKNYLHLHKQPIAIWLQGTTTFINLHQKANQWAVTLCPSSITTLGGSNASYHAHLTFRPFRLPGILRFALTISANAFGTTCSSDLHALNHRFLTTTIYHESHLHLPLHSCSN